jgi:hypothetical protein
MMKIDGMSFNHYLKDRAKLYFRPLLLLAKYAHIAAGRKHISARSLVVFPLDVVNEISHNIEQYISVDIWNPQVNGNASSTFSVDVLSPFQLGHLQPEVCNG